MKPLRTLNVIGATVLGVVLFSVTLAATNVLAQGPDGPLIPAQPRSSTASQGEPPAHAASHALNWAGYIAVGHTYSGVSGSWIVPHVEATSDHVADATWVGIGGAVSTDLIQAGTEVVPDDSGTLTYQAWYELLPDSSTAVPLPISPGDAISVVVKEERPGTWSISFTNATTGQHYEKSVHYNSSRSSADWIEEMPVEVGGAMSLDNFGSVHFTSGEAIVDGRSASIAGSGAEAVVMDNPDGYALAVPSRLNPASGFTVVRTDAEAAPLAFSQEKQHAVPADDQVHVFVDQSSAYTAHAFDENVPDIIQILFTGP